MNEFNVNQAFDQDPVSSSVIKESDFPQKNKKLNLILSRYRKKNNIQKKPTHNLENPFANTKIVNELRIRRFDELSEDEKQKVIARIKGVDYMSAMDILNFGTTRQSRLTKSAELIIAQYSVEEVDITGSMSELVATLKSNNPSQIIQDINIEERNEWGVFSGVKSAISMNNTKKKLDQAMAMHDNIMNNIRTIEIELKKQQIDLQKDIEIYQDMTEKAYEQIAVFELDCIALSVMIEEVTQKFQKMVYGKTLDPIQLNQANNLKYVIERMEGRMYTIKTIRFSLVQSIPQLAVLIYGNEILAEKIEEISSVIIPLWTWQYAIALGAIKQKQAVDIQKLIKGITSKLLTGNAQILHDNMIAVQKEIHDAAVAIEDLSVVQNYFDDMMNTINEIRASSVKKQVQGMKTIKQMENKNFLLFSKK